MKKPKKMKKPKMATQETMKEAGRIISGAYAGFQEVRIGSLNRIRDVIRKKAEGIPVDAVEDKKVKKKFDQKYIDAQLPGTLKKLYKDKKITKKEHDFIKTCLEMSFETGKLENKYKRHMEKYIEVEPVWTDYLSTVKGIGPVLATEMIRRFGYCETYEHVSSLWSHAGLHVVDGEAPRRRKGEQLNYNPKLKVLAWKIADSLVKQNSPPYRGIYDKEKKRQLARMTAKTLKVGTAPKNKMHAHLRAMRKMVKIFLEHYWLKSRTLVGLETGRPYIIGKGKHSHYISPP